MLPDNLASSYERYKKDTNTFAAWLYANALSCGYTAPISIIVQPIHEDDDAQTGPGRLKGKARKEAQAAAKSLPKQPKSELKTPKESKHVLPTIQLLKQAKAIVASPKNIKVPIIIQRLLRDAIKARKRCTGWFTKVAAKEEAADLEELGKKNNSHEYFIKVLEMTFDILKPCFEVPQQKKSSRAATVADVDDDGNEIVNKFENLEMEDIDEAAYDALPSVVPKSSKAGNIELEIDVDADLPFVVFCFYEDMHDFRRLIVETWHEVREEKLSYMTASLVTDIVLELVRQEEDILLASFPSLGEASYVAITSKIFPVRIPNKLPNGTYEEAMTVLDDLRDAMDAVRADANETAVEESTEADVVTPLVDNFLFTSTFHILEKCRTAMSIHKTSSLPAVESLEMVYQWSPESRVNNPLLEKEDSLLSKFLLEIELILQTNILMEQKKKAHKAGLLEQLHSTSFEPSPVQDKLTAELRGSLSDKQKSVSMSQVFAARSLLDICLVLGFQKTKYIYNSLLQRGATAFAVLEITWSRNKDMVKCIQTTEELLDKWVHKGAAFYASKLSHTIVAVIKHPSLVSYKHNVLSGTIKSALADSMKSFDVNRLPGEVANFLTEFGISDRYLEESLQDMHTIMPSDDPTFYFECLPMYNGLEALKTTLELSQIGFDLANDFYSLMSMAHLYNFLQQQGLLSGRWILMDRIIEENLSKLFSNSLPEDIKSCSRRFFICVGLPLETLSPTRRQMNFTLRPKFKKFENFFTPQPLVRSLGEYFGGTVSGEKLLFDVFKQQAQSKVQRRHGATHLQLLAQLKTAMEEGLPSIEIDIIGLVRQCNNVFRYIQEECTSRLLVQHQYYGQKEEDIGHGRNIIIVADIFLEVECMNVGQEQLARRVEDGDTRVAIATRVLQDFLKDANAATKVKPFDVLASAKKSYEEGFAAFTEREFKKWKRAMDYGL